MSDDPKLRIPIVAGPYDGAAAQEAARDVKKVGDAAAAAGAQAGSGAKIGAEGMKEFSKSGVEAGHVVHNLEIASQGGVRGMIALFRAGVDMAKIFGTVVLANPILAAVAAVGLVVAGFAVWINKIKETSKTFEQLQKANDVSKEHTEAMVATALRRLDAYADKLREIISLYDEIDGDISRNISHSQQVTSAQKQLELSKLEPGDEKGRAAIDQKYAVIEAQDAVSGKRLLADNASRENDAAQSAFGGARSQMTTLQSRLADARFTATNSPDADERYAAVQVGKTITAEIEKLQPKYDAMQDTAGKVSAKASAANDNLEFEQKLGAIKIDTATAAAGHVLGDPTATTRGALGGYIKSPAAMAALHDYNVAKSSGDDTALSDAVSHLQQIGLAFDSVTGAIQSTATRAAEAKKKADLLKRQQDNQNN